MANSFFVPFNHQPDSVTFHTAPVTLGSDEYARLIVLPHQELDDGAPQGDQSLTIDGTIAVPQTQWSSTDLDSNEDITFRCSGTVYYYYDSGNAQYQSRINDSTTGMFNISLTSGAPSSPGLRTLGVVSAGDRFEPNSMSGRYFKMVLNPFEPIPKEFWLPPSTVISSADGSIVRNYMLERYNLYS